MKNTRKFRTVALVGGLLLFGGTSYLRAQSTLYPMGYPPASKTPEAAALGFYKLLGFIRQPPRGHYEPDDQTTQQTLGSIERKQFAALSSNPNAEKLIRLMATQALDSTYDTAVQSSDAGQTIVQLTPSNGPKAREVVVVPEDGGYRVDVKATFGRWNDLTGADLDKRWATYVVAVPDGSDPFTYSRDNALKASCQSNMKQQMLGIMQYAQDYDEKLPPASKWVEVLQPYTKSEQIFQCPSMPATTKGPGYGYAYNQYLSGFVQSNIKQPAMTVNVYETLNPSRNWYGRGTGRAYRHLGGSNIGFADGHVKWFPKGQEKGVTFKP